MFTRLRLFWRQSLLLRMLSLSVGLSLVAMAVIGGYMAVSIGQNLFDQRRDDAVLESVRATESLARVFSEQVTQTSTTGEMDVVRSQALNAASSVFSNRTDTAYAMFRIDGQDDPELPMSDVQIGSFDDSLISKELHDAMTEGQGTPYYQSVALDDDGTTPGLIVGTTVEVPRNGAYAFYVIYSLQAEQSTLESMQTTMLLGGIALAALIVLITWLVVHLVIGPVQLVADTSAKLASGSLDVRIPVHGDDALAKLARSFNDMADSISEQITKLATLSNVQQRFVSDVSHELRTPLTTIRLAGDVIYDRREDFDAVTARTTELLRAQIERFERLLADLLELSRFDAGAATLDTEPTNLVKLAEGEVQAVEPLAAERGSELRVIAPGGYFEADVDPRRIRRILQNFLGNAIDHGEGRPISVIVDSNQTTIAIVVRDHGMGIREDDLARVFDRFWRADPSRQRRTGGTGLGLAISRDDAALHAGVIDVWSAPGEGSAFRLTLPRAVGDPLVSPIDLPPDDYEERGSVE